MPAQAFGSPSRSTQAPAQGFLPRPHPTSDRRTDPFPIIIGGGYTSHIHQQHLYKAQIKGDRAIATTAEDTRSVTDQGRPSGGGTIKNILATGQRLGANSEGRLFTAQIFGEFKGCLRHKSKGGG